MTTLTSLRRALQAVEAAIPSFAVRLLQASPEARDAYRQYRSEMATWCAARPHGAAFAALLAGEMPPAVPPLLRSIILSAPLVREGDDTGAIYRAMLERK